MKRTSIRQNHREVSENSDLELKKRHKSHEESSDSDSGESEKSESDMEIKLNRTNNLDIPEKDDSSIFETGQVRSCV